MYYMLVTNQNEMYATQVQRIMQRSKLVDDLYFIVEQTYNSHDMTQASVMLEYLLPVSRKYKTEYLVLSEEKYNDTYLQYKLPIDTELTSEAGQVELQLTFAYTELDASGRGFQHVRKTSPARIDVIPIAAWSDIIPDSALSALDQRLIKLDAQMRGLNELANSIEATAVDDIAFDKDDETIHLTANGEQVGNKISVKEMLEEGVPVVDIGGSESDGADTDDDGIIEF